MIPTTNHDVYESLRSYYKIPLINQIDITILLLLSIFFPFQKVK